MVVRLAAESVCRESSEASVAKIAQNGAISATLVRITHRFGGPQMEIFHRVAHSRDGYMLIAAFEVKKEIPVILAGRVSVLTKHSPNPVRALQVHHDRVRLEAKVTPKRRKENEKQTLRALTGTRVLCRTCDCVSRNLRGHSRLGFDRDGTSRRG